MIACTRARTREDYVIPEARRDVWVEDVQEQAQQPPRQEEGGDVHAAQVDEVHCQVGHPLGEQTLQADRGKRGGGTNYDRSGVRDRG